jgi:hypothetical protein
MENITKQSALRILGIFGEINKGFINPIRIDEGYRLLPVELQSTVTNQNAKILAINRFVILNNKELMDIIAMPDDAEIEIKKTEVVINGNPATEYKVKEKVITTDRMAKARAAKKTKMEKK